MRASRRGLKAAKCKALLFLKGAFKKCTTLSIAIASTFLLQGVCLVKAAQPRAHTTAVLRAVGPSAEAGMENTEHSGLKITSDVQTSSSLHADGHRHPSSALQGKERPEKGT